MQENGARKKVSGSLMDGESQDAWFIVESCLDAIAMVGIEVEIQHACLAFAHRGGNRDGRVVVDAKAVCAISRGVVEPARRMKSMLEGTVEHPTYSVQAATGYVRGGRMHPDKCWGIAGPEAPTTSFSREQWIVGKHIEVLYGVDVA